MLRIDVLTLFPEMFSSVFAESMLKRAQDQKKVKILVHDIRSQATDKHKTCDDRPFGGGPGMVLKPEPIDRVARKILGTRPKKDLCFLYMTPQGKPFNQKMAMRLAKKKRLVILCGHYEGVDQRVVDRWVTEEISLGDYVLTGGEIPAMAVVDTVARLVPGVLGNEASKNFESFTENLLEYPQYTRPAVFRGVSVPSVLLTGNHKAIEAWRRDQSLHRTAQRRPDLLKRSKRRK